MTPWTPEPTLVLGSNLAGARGVYTADIDIDTGGWETDMNDGIVNQGVHLSMTLGAGPS